jgi:glycosyltransferase involved in cell wall biosynthesis
LNILITNSAQKYIGEAAHCFDLAEQLRAEGHEVMLVVKRGSALDRRVTARGLQMRRLVFSSSFRPIGDLIDAWRLRYLILAFRADVVHCHRGKDHWVAVAARLFARKHVPIVRTRHLVTPVKTHGANQWLFRKGTDFVIAVSQKAAESLGELRQVIGSRFRVIYSSVDTTIFDPSRRSEKIRKQLGVKPGELVVGLVARFQRIKGQEVLLNAAPQIVARVPNVRFLVAGRGPGHKPQKYEKLARELGVWDRVILDEWLEDVPGVLASLDVGVLASLGSEGSSRITYEYLASGTAVVASNVGCIPEVLHDEQTGLVVPPGDSAGLAAAVIRVLTDNSLANKLREKGLERARTFHNRARWINEILEVYTTVTRPR